MYLLRTRWMGALALSLLGACGPGGMSGPDAMTPGPDASGTDGMSMMGTEGGTGSEGGTTTDAARESGTMASCGMIAGGMCNVVSNAGCMTGQACILAQNMGGMVSSTCARAGTGGYNAACTTADACMEGFACLSGRCVKLCCGAGDDETCRSGAGGVPGATCSGAVGGPNGENLGIFACTAPVRCDVFSQDCPMGGNCRPIREDGTTTCMDSGMVATNGSCMSATACQRGNICIVSMQGASSGNCRRFCEVGAMSGDRACPSGFVCGPLMNAPRTVGVCVPMM